MSIPLSLLAMLDGRPMYGYELRSEFEARTGGTWPLNVGQVYTTLGRLERDGLVQPAGDDGKGHVYYRITDAGSDAVRDWFASPVNRSAPSRDELAIKLALAVTLPEVDVRSVIQAQRTATMRTLQELTVLKPRAAEAARAEGAAGELAWLLVLDSLVFQAEAEIRWLDHCEARLARAASDAGAAARPAAVAPTTTEVPR